MQHLQVETHLQNNEHEVRLGDSMSKRSDDQEFQDWQITMIKSGKFIFDPIQKSQSNSPRVPQTKVQPLSVNSEVVECQSCMGSKGSGLNRELVRLIFVHFCKQNYISSIKSTLFQDKQRLSQTMNINKWMVFSKEYSLLQQLSNHYNSTPLFSKTKLLKNAENNLTNIFKKCSDNQSTMNFQQFLSAIGLVYESIKEKNACAVSDKGDFNKKYLFCSSQKECKAKLASLKFTFPIAQIHQSAHHPRSIQKRKAHLSSSKQNHEPISRNKSIHVVPNPKMKLNTIISQAKTKVTNKPTLQLSRKYVSKIKLVGEHKQSQGEKKKQVIRLEGLVDPRKDEILEAYLHLEYPN